MARGVGGIADVTRKFCPAASEIVYEAAGILYRAAAGDATIRANSARKNRGGPFVGAI